ncbi:MFS transporter [Arthrobacter sp. StoSoilB5]|uniref:MFS transporter n=1 Tax=Arthrobacter sp. StoSoilB5 TaxID=2830992 RepID=UPI001CC66622|nr:MFS transporter [Arthrobacter sp. StoSoilB5]
MQDKEIVVLDESRSAASGLTEAAPPALSVRDGAAVPQEPVSGLWMALYTLANIGYWLAVITPGVIALPLKVTSLVGSEQAPAALGIVAAAGPAIALIATPVFGRLSDRTTSRLGRRRPYLLLNPLIGVVGAVMGGLAPNIAVLAVGYGLLAIGFTGSFGALAPVVADRVPVNQRGLVSGLIGISVPVGLVGGTFVVQYIATDPLLPLAVPAAMGAILIIMFGVHMKDARLAPESRPAASWRSLPATFWVNPRRYPDFAWAWWGRALLLLAYALLTLYQTFFLIDRLGIPASEVANYVFLSMLVLSVTMVASSIIGGRLSDVMERRKPFIIGSAVIYGAALLVIATSTTFTQFLIGIAITGLGNGAYTAVDAALATQVLPNPDDTAKDLGVFNIAATFPNAAAPAIAPLILAIGGGNYTVLFAVAGGIAIISALAIVPIKGVR